MRFPVDVNKYTINSDIYQNPFLHWHLFGFKIFGYVIFFDVGACARRLHCLRGMIFTATFVAFNITQFMDLFMSDNLDQMMTNASSTLLFLTTTFRMYIFYSKRSKFLKLIKNAHENLVIIMNSPVEEEQRIYRKHFKYMKKLTTGFWICAWITGNMMCVNTFFQAISYNPDSSTNIDKGFNKTSGPPIIFRSWFPFENLWENYYYVYGTHLYIMYLGMAIVPTWHSFMVSVLIYVITYLEIINYRLQNIKKYLYYPKEYSKFSSMNIQRNWFRKTYNSRKAILGQCVEIQVQMKSFVHDFQTLNASSLFVDFVVFSGLICALLFQASKVGFGVTLIINVFYIFTMVIILWLYYWHADEIFKQSEYTAQAIYNSDWVETSLTSQKNCLLLMTASSRPIKMSALFISLNVSTFLNILRASYSYYTLLAQMDS